MKKRVATFLVLVMTLLPLMADNVKLAGRVIDNEDNPVEFATVRIDGTSIGTNTDLQGYYNLSVAPRDTLVVIFSSIGFKTEKRKLIDPKGDITLNVKMMPDNTLLDEVQVVATKVNSNGMQSITIDNLKTSPDVTGGSVEAMLSTMAGVNSNNEMSSQYSVRGGSFDENSVYINGMEIYRPQLMRNGEQEGMSIINPDMVGNIRFSTGGFPARYADKMSSVLDITYREPQSFEGAFAASLMGANLAIGTNSGKFSQISGIRFKKNNSLLSSLETRGEYDPSYFDFQTNMTFKGSEKFNVNFMGNIALNTYNFKPANRETNFGTAEDVKQFTVYFDGQEKDKFQTFTGALNMNFKPKSRTELTFSTAGFMTNEYVSYDISGEYWLNQAGTSDVGGELGVGKYMEHSRNRLKASVLQLALKGRTALGRNNLSYGIIYQHEKFHDRTREWEWRDSAGYSLPAIPDAVYLIYNLDSKQDIGNSRLAFYGEDSFNFESSKMSFNINTGLRFSYATFNREFLASPRVNLNMTPKEHNRWNFRFLVGMYYQSPFYKEFRRTEEDEFGNLRVVLNKDIKSPRSLQFILGTDYVFRTFDRPFKLTGEVYYKALSRLISYEYDNLKVNYSGVNDSNGFIYGLDAKLYGQFVEGSDSWLSLSLMKTQQTLNGVKVPLPSDQRYSVALFFTDYFPKFPKLRFSLRGIFSDGLTMTPPRVPRSQAWFRAPSYKRVDIGLSYQLVGAPTDGVRPYNFWRHFKSIIIGVDVFNLFDISNVSSYYWVTDVNDIQYAVPNYLTRRQFNIRLSCEF